MNLSSSMAPDIEELVVPPNPTNTKYLHTKGWNLTFQLHTKRCNLFFFQLQRAIKNRKLHFICNQVLICHKNISIKHRARCASWGMSHYPQSFNVQKQCQNHERKGWETLLHGSQGTIITVTETCPSTENVCPHSIGLVWGSFLSRGGWGEFSPIMSEVSSPAIPQFQSKSKSLLSQIHLKPPNFSIFSWFSAPVGLLVLQVNSNLQLEVLLLLALAQRLITLITFRKHSTLPCKENPSREQALVAAWRAEIKGCHLGLQSPRTYDWRYGIFEL